MRALIFCVFLWLFQTAIYSQSIPSDSLPCHLLLQKASHKYETVFNFNDGVVSEIKCLNYLPESFQAFKKNTEEFTGLHFESYAENYWIIQKNHTHELRIVDEMEQPIADAFLYGLDLKSNTYGKIFFTINSKSITLKVSHPQFETKQVKVSAENTSVITLQLSLKPILLPEVSLPSLYVNSIYQTKEQHLQVNTKKTPLLAGQTQQDALVSLLNLPQIFTTTESVAELTIKGGINDQNLVLWNGIRMFQNAHFFGLLTAFNENLIDQITLMDNATPAMYGNALSGTVRLDFDPQFAKKNQYGVGINALNTQAFTRQALAKDTELSLAIRRSLTDVFNTVTFQSYTQKAYRDTDLELNENPFQPLNIQREDEFYYQDVQFQLKKKFSEKFRLHVQGIWFENQLTYEEITSQERFISKYDNANKAIGIDGEYRLNSNENLVLKTNYTQHSSTGNNNTISGNLQTNQSNTIDHYFTQAYWKKEGASYQLSAGFDYEGSIVTNRFNNAVTEAFLNLGQVGNIYAAMADYTYFNDRWRWYAGLRTAYYQRDDRWRLEPRFNLTYHLSKKIDVVLRGEVKSQNFKQVIDLDQNFLGIEKRRWVISGDSISPPLQTAQQLETMIQWRYNKVGGYASVFVRGFQGISVNDQRFQNQNQFEGFENASSSLFGALFHVYYKNDWLNSWISFTHLNEQIKTPTEDFPASNNLDYQLTWGNHVHWKNWNFSWSFLYQDGLLYTAIDPENPVLPLPESNLNTINYQRPNAAKLPAYFRMDSSIQYQWKTKQKGTFSFSLGLINLTNQHTILRRNYRLNRVTDEVVEQIETIGLGFTPNLGILWTF